MDTSGGLMSILSKKINHLTNNGYRVTIYSIIKHNQSFYNISNNVKIVSSESSKNFLTTVISFIKFLRRNKFDIIITADAKYLSWVIPYIVKTRRVWEIHQSYEGIKEYFQKSRFPNINFYLRKLCYKLVLPKYSRVVVLTEEDKEKWKSKNIKVIPNFHSIPKKNPSVPSKTIVCLGRFHYQKGYDLLIEVWKKVSLRFPEWTLHYYGVDKNQKILDTLYELNTPDSFKIMGRVSDLDKIYSGAYLNIVPSRCESFSLSIIEAMAYGIPTVAFTTSGPNSIISNDKNGILVKKNNVILMEKAITDLILNPAKRNELSVNCFRESKKYTENKIMINWIELLETLCKSPTTD